jgi:hypothetical protein
MADEQNVLGSLSSKSRARLRRRLLQRLRSMRNEGGAIFVLSAALLLACVLFWQRYIDVSRLDELRLQNGFRATFGTKQEPRDNVEYPGVTSAVLAHVNAERATVCESTNDAACISGGVFLNAMGDLFDLWKVNRSIEGGAQDNDTTTAGSKSQQQLPEQLDNLFHKYLPNVAPYEAWRNGARMAIEDSGGPELKACSSLLPQRPADSALGIGEAGCTDDPVPSGMISIASPFAYSVWSQLFGKTGMNNLDEDAKNLRNDARAAAALAKLTDYAIALANRACEACSKAASSNNDKISSDPSERPEKTRWVAAYFITHHNFLRFWRPGLDNPLADMPRAHSWVGASYFRRFVGEKSPPTEYRTLAYIDFGGNGIVSTQCRPLQEYDGKKRTLYGVVCADYSLPLFSEQMFRDALAQDPFLNFVMVKIPAKAQVAVSDFVSPEATNLDKRDLANLARALNAFLSPPQSRADIAKDVSRFDVGAETNFLVPLSLLANGELEAILVRLKTIDDSSSEMVYLGLALVCSVLWLALLVVSFTWARHNADLLERIALFRSLKSALSKRKEWTC